MAQMFMRVNSKCAHQGAPTTGPNTWSAAVGQTLGDKAGPTENPPIASQTGGVTLTSLFEQLQRLITGDVRLADRTNRKKKKA